MRAAFWFLGLFAVAVAVALFAARNEGTVTVFLPPYRVDLSLNLVVMLAALGFALLYGATRALAALFELPRDARRWRAAQRERSVVIAALEASAQARAGRYARAQRKAIQALAREKALSEGGQPLAQGPLLRALAQLTVAEGAHALQNPTQRDHALGQALTALRGDDTPQARELASGVQLHAARWALDDRDPEAARVWLADLPPVAGRRVAARRLRWRAAHMAGHWADARQGARQLARHGDRPSAQALADMETQAAQAVAAAPDLPALRQMVRAWADGPGGAAPAVILQAVARGAVLGGDPALALHWLEPLWMRAQADPDALSADEQASLMHFLAQALSAAPDEPAAHAWHARIDAAQQARPADPALQHLAGMSALTRQAWGRAQGLLTQAVRELNDPALRQQAWCALAQLAQQRDDGAAALEAWRQAAQAAQSAQSARSVARPAP